MNIIIQSKAIGAEPLAGPVLAITRRFDGVVVLKCADAAVVFEVVFNFNALAALVAATRATLTDEQALRIALATPEDVRARLTATLKSDGKIAALRQARELLGLDLHEARNLIEAVSLVEL